MERTEFDKFTLADLQEAIDMLAALSEFQAEQRIRADNGALVKKHGVTVKVLSRAVKKRRDSIQAAKRASKPFSENEGRYLTHKRRICERKFDRNGERTEPLCNFNARIVEEHLRDDGTEQDEHLLQISGTLVTGEPLSLTTVEAKNFAAMNWVVPAWGARAVVGAGIGTKDRLREAMQLLSTPITRRMYAHAGWRMIGGVPVYLNATGGIGALGATDSVEVEARSLARFELRPAKDNAELRSAVSRSLSIRELTPLSVTGRLLLGAIYLAPLQALLAEEPPDFVFGLFGESGAQKSELAALAQAHFGVFMRTNLMTFSSTGNAIERALFDAKDAVCVVDDFHPANSLSEEHDLNMKFVRLLRSVGERAGRRRMNRDTTAKRELPPRALVIITGERRPTGHSNLGRLFPVELIKGSVSLPKLSELQERRELLRVAMGSFVQWLACYFEPLSAWLPARFRALRSEFQTELRPLGTHAREPGQLAYLQLGIETLALFAADLGMLTGEGRKALVDGVHDALLGLALEHGQDSREERPVERFLAQLADGFAAKAIYVEGFDHGGSGFESPTSWGWQTRTYFSDGEAQAQLVPGPRAKLIGWIDANWLRLIPEATEQFLAESCRQVGRRPPTDKATLHRHLQQAGLIETATEQRDGKPVVRRTVKERIGNAFPRVLKLKRAAVATEPGGNGAASGNSKTEQNLDHTDLVPTFPLFPQKMEVTQRMERASSTTSSPTAANSTPF